MKSRTLQALALGAAVSVLAGCASTSAPVVANTPGCLDDVAVNRLLGDYNARRPAANLPDDERTRFVIGNSFFRRNWVEAPASTKARDGLGPHFIARSCGGCHVQDGRGEPPAIFNRLGDVVNIDVIAKHRRCVHISGFNRCASKAQIGSIWQCIAQILGKTIHRAFAYYLTIFIQHIGFFGLKTIL